MNAKLHLGFVLFLTTMVTLSGCGPALTGLQPGLPPGARLETQYDKGLGVAPLPAPTMAPSVQAGKGAEPFSPVAERMIVKTATISITVRDTQEALGQVSALAGELKGYVVTSSSRYEGDRLLATVTIKVPATSFDDALTRLRKIASKVDSENTSGQDVTEEYTDLTAQLKNLEATEAQLLKFLDRTQNVDEALKVYRELTNIRGQIERIKGRMNYLEKSAAMSTITVNIRPQPKDEPIVKEEGWQPLRVMRDALRALVSALEGIANVAIWIVLFLLPILLVLLAPFILIWLAWLWSRKRRQARAKL
ncbi:MAG: DUF4349 domain-containing protein [Chloroflexi bacterium]|nr:DUF4349 domain-containing protein [Chloroflexota bacterium]